MAYSDYGAFVYKNRKRRHDREDVCPYESGNPSVGAGLRIYDTLAKRLAERDGIVDAPDDIAEHPILGRSFHGVLGGGNVRVCLYKEGAEMCTVIYKNDDGEYDEISGGELIDLAVSEKSGETPYADMKRASDAYNKATESVTNAGYDNVWDLKEDNDDPVIKKYFSARDEYLDAHEKLMDYAYGNYDYLVTWHGCSIRLIGKPVDDEDTLYTEAPCWMARMIDENRDVWVCGYGSLYGSGWSDYGEDDERYTEIADDNPPVVKTMNLIADEREVLDENNEYIIGKQGYLYSNSGELVYRGQQLNDDDEYGLAEWSSIDYGTRYVSPEDVIALLNIGIRLGNNGINAVRCDGSIQDYQSGWNCVTMHSWKQGKEVTLHESDELYNSESMTDAWFDKKRLDEQETRENRPKPFRYVDEESES